MSRPTVATIDLAALRHNHALAVALGGAGQTLPIVKANAYGHGLIEIARVLEPLAPALGVACIEEAVALREAGIAKPVLLLEGFFSVEELELAAARDFWPMVHNEVQLRVLEAAKLDRPVHCWLKVDTGMHRLGVEPARAAEYWGRLNDCPSVAGTPVLATHFAAADELDNNFNHEQMTRFADCGADIPAPRSLANSAALLGRPDTRAEWNRPGLMLYGSSPFAAPHPEADKLRPVMTVRSAVSALRTIEAGDSVGYSRRWTASRTSRIATIPVGYGDGYPRTAENGAPVLVAGQKATLAGRVSMDMITVDVTDLADVSIGDEVVLWGEGLDANEVARHANTNGYEILTRLPPRLPRKYLPATSN